MNLSFTSTRLLMQTGVIGATLLFGAAFVHNVAAQTTPPPAKDKPVAAAKAPAKVAKKAAPVVVAPEPVIAAADPLQMAAAKEVLTGSSSCEFGQQIKLDDSVKFPGYIDLSFNNKVYVMKPVESSTGALRLEDVRAETLLIQIGNKTMLMNQKTGQRLVDNCVHPKQQTVTAANQSGGSLLGGPSK